MTQKFSVKRCLIFIAVLFSMLGLTALYSDALFDKSLGLIQKFEKGHATDGSLVRFTEIFAFITDDAQYFIMFMVLSPFLSRERFWYYLISFQISYANKITFKMILSEPRAIWVWSDLSAISCSKSFGSPSGHATRSANVGSLFLLDLFFASDWSRSKYPALNNMSVCTHKLAFGLLSLFFLVFWLVNLYDPIFLG